MNTEYIRRIKDGDEEAFRWFFDRYWNRVYGFAKIYLTDAFEREEVTQKVFIRLWENRKSLDEDKNIDGLLFILTRNMIFDEKRRSLDRQAVRETLQQALLVPQDGSGEEFETADLSAYIETLVEQLPPRQHDTFILSRKNGLKNREIAELFSITEKGVERNMTEALKFIRKNLPFLILFMRL